MSAHASQAFSIAHCADSEDLPQNWQVYGNDIKKNRSTENLNTTAKHIRIIPVTVNTHDYKIHNTHISWRSQQHICFF